MASLSLDFWKGGVRLLVCNVGLKGLVEYIGKGQMINGRHLLLIFVSESKYSTVCI